MAAHMQEQILTALAALLVAASTAAGANVFIDRPDELPVSKIPAITLEAGEEQISSEGVNHPWLQTRTWLVDAVAICAGSGAAADARDLAKEIEQAFYASFSTATVGGLTRPIELLAARPQLTGQANQLVAELRQTWQITYATRSGTPDATA